MKTWVEISMDIQMSETVSLAHSDVAWKVTMQNSRKDSFFDIGPPGEIVSSEELCGGICQKQ